MRLEHLKPNGKFLDPDVTLGGEPRALVPFEGLRTLWFNTGTLCNIACRGCYIESGPRNDRLIYLARGEVRDYLDEIARERMPVREIGFTGGEPFMNPDIIGMIEDSLMAGFGVLVLTNAMKPMQRLKADLLHLLREAEGRLRIRVSLDHYTAAGHELQRGAGTWQPAIDGLGWLAGSGFDVAVASRTIWAETEGELRKGFGGLFADQGWAIDPEDANRLVLFPEMDEAADVPEITQRCWGILGVAPHDMMCASARMVVKRKGDDRPAVVACTLIPYDERFQLGRSLSDSAGAVRLNHVHCAKFCVLGGGACSRG